MYVAKQSISDLRECAGESSRSLVIQQRILDREWFCFESRGPLKQLFPDRVSHWILVFYCEDYRLASAPQGEDAENVSSSQRTNVIRF
jgi:hypothetical protein